MLEINLSFLQSYMEETKKGADESFEDVSSEVQALQAGLKALTQQVNLHSNDLTAQFKALEKRCLALEAEHKLRDSLIQQQQQALEEVKMAGGADGWYHMMCLSSLIWAFLVMFLVSHLPAGWGVPGLKWEGVGSDKPKTGTEIQNAALAKALQTRFEFTRADIDRFGVSNLSYNCYIKVDGKYFKPAGSHFGKALMMITNRLGIYKALEWLRARLGLRGASSRRHKLPSSQHSGALYVGGENGKHHVLVGHSSMGNLQGHHPGRAAVSRIHSAHAPAPELQVRTSVVRVSACAHAPSFFHCIFLSFYLSLSRFLSLPPSPSPSSSPPPSPPPSPSPPLSGSPPLSFLPNPPELYPSIHCNLTHVLTHVRAHSRAPLESTARVDHRISKCRTSHIFPEAPALGSAPPPPSPPTYLLIRILHYAPLSRDCLDVLPLSLRCRMCVCV